MGKTRNLFKKIRASKGTFHAKMGTIKDKSSMNLTEAENEEEARKHRKNYTKKILMPQITTVV